LKYQRKVSSVDAYFYTTKEWFEREAPTWLKELATFKGGILILTTGHRTAAVAKGLWIVQSDDRTTCHPISSISFDKLYEAVKS